MQTNGNVPPLTTYVQCYEKSWLAGEWSRWSFPQMSIRDCVTKSKTRVVKLYTWLVNKQVHTKCNSFAVEVLSRVMCGFPGFVFFCWFPKAANVFEAQGSWSCRRLFVLVSTCPPATPSSRQLVHSLRAQFSACTSTRRSLAQTDHCTSKHWHEALQ